MKKIRFVLIAVCILLTGCSSFKKAADTKAKTEPIVINDNILESYYLSEDNPVYSYLQNNSIQRFFNMWLEEYMHEPIEVEWNYNTLAPVQMLDHNFDFIVKTDGESDKEFYTCTFSADNGQCGYIIVSYGEDGPHINKWSLHETTPYQYDLRANEEKIAAALNETDIDLSTASAARVEWIDTDKNRGDRIILFTDGKNDKYICYLGDDDFALEKQ